MAPITKRLRENSNGEMKTNKGLDMSSILQLINERFKEQGEMIASKMSESEERILSVLHERLDGMSAEIQKLCVRVEKLERDVSKVDALKTQVGLLESKLSSLATAEVANDLRMHGVPFCEGESLKTILNSICFSLGITPAPKLKDICRIRQGKTASTVVDPTIIIKLENARDKIALLRAAGEYRRTTKQLLNLQLLGFDSCTPIYLNEQLTRETYTIFKEAMRMKRQRLLTAVFCRRACVYVKRSERSEPLCVESFQTLLRMQAESSEISANAPPE
ncbi:hypothetical protein ACLKA6_008126 [Drosophila palustris]